MRRERRGIVCVCVLEGGVCERERYGIGIGGKYQIAEQPPRAEQSYLFCSIPFSFGWYMFITGCNHFLLIPLKWGEG